MGEAQSFPAVEQAPTTDAQVLVLGSQMPEQHSVLCTQVAPNALQSGPNGPLPEVPLPPTALAPATGLVLAPPSCWLVPALLELVPPLVLDAPVPWSPPAASPASASPEPGPSPPEEDEPHAQVSQIAAAAPITKRPALMLVSSRCRGYNDRKRVGGTALCEL